jgi:hypothetical protein
MSGRESGASLPTGPGPGRRERRQRADLAREPEPAMGFSARHQQAPDILASPGPGGNRSGGTTGGKWRHQTVAAELAVCQRAAPCRRQM